MTDDLFAVLPEPTAASKPFWDACEQEQLLMPRCETCAKLFYYPRIHCPHCGSRALGWQRVAGRGRVFSFTHVAVSFHGAAWDSQLPYTVVLVTLDEGPQMLTRLIGEDRAAVQSGDPVEFVFPRIDGRRLPMVRRATHQSIAKATTP